VYLVQSDFSNDLLSGVFAESKVAPLVMRIGISNNANGIKLNAFSETSRATGSRLGGVQGYWLAEAAQKTFSAPKFRQMELSLKKLVCISYVTDELLSDVSILQDVLTRAFKSEISFMLDDSIINGSGVGQPLGILNSAACASVTRNTASEVNFEDIIGMWARVINPANAVWLINQDIVPSLYKMSLTVGAGGVAAYLPANGLAGSPYPTLMGRPVIPTEQNPSLGTKGDIILANLKDGYLLIDKGAAKMDSSIHVRFIYDESTLRMVYRCDGQPILNACVVPFKGSANTVSHFVALT
jgi:HK97 family phage major capsid protein